MSLADLDRPRPESAGPDLRVPPPVVVGLNLIMKSPWSIPPASGARYHQHREHIPFSGL